VDTPIAKWASTELQRFLPLHHWPSAWRSIAAIHKCGIGSLFRRKTEPHAPCPILNISDTRASTFFGLVSQVIQKPFGHYYAQSKYWPPLLGKGIQLRSLPYYENGRQQPVNDVWLCIMGNQSAMHRLLCIYNVLTVFLGETGHEFFGASLEMKLVVTVWEAVTGMSLAYLPREAANSSLIEVCNHAPLRLPNMRDLKLLMLICRSFSRWGRDHVASAFAYKGSQFLRYDYLQPMPAQITQDARPKIVDAHSQDGAGSVCLHILITKAASTSKRNNYVPSLIFYD